MMKFKLSCVVVAVAMLLSEGYSLPQGGFRGRQRQQQEVVNQQPAHNLDPIAAEGGMNSEHAKLIENLQRLKRTLDHVKERVAKGTYGEQSQVDMKNPEGAILTVLKSLQEQGQLFAMINDMLKAGSQVQSQTEKIKQFSQLHEQARAESALPQHAETTHPTGPAPSSPSSLPPSAPAPTGPTAASLPVTQYSRGRLNASTTQKSRPNPSAVASKEPHYDDYSYQYREDSPRDDHYDYHYDQGYESQRGSAQTTTTTTTTRRPPPQRRLRGRITSRSDFF